MRKFLIPLLLASVVMPAVASAREGERGTRVRAESDDGERASAPKDRPQRAAREQRSNDSEQAVQVERSERPVRIERLQRVERPAAVETEVQQTHSAEPVQRVRRIERAERPVRIHREERQVQTAEPIQQVQSNEPVQQVRTRRSSDNLVDGLRASAREEQAREQGQVVTHRDRDSRSGSHGDYHRDLRKEHGDLHASDPNRREHREWHRQAERQHDRRHQSWSTNWRTNSYYDWYSYRSRYSSLYRLGRYYDPYGWGYRRFSIGFNLWPSYYGSNYWLNDPWQYRLPPAYGPYRWVRYHDDALLVNIYTGTVVDVIYNFFW